MPAFLSEDWFSTVEQLTAQAGDLNLPPALKNLAINFVVNNTSGNTELSLDGGKIQKGLADNAKTTLNLDEDTLRKVFLEFDLTAAMQAFMTGKIKVQGDMSQLMALQTARPSQEQKTLYKEILQHTA
ncbi:MULTISPECIES: SCP2 sterol-binding domain-containing protein [Acinetobacter]|uniref:SCP2 sterol-binding domain-containing protein n=1 Tax=Acinetobacter TaxID=469 RepID=UPI00124E4063|nr:MULTISPECIES: SCP2 sterol-binding domain-containing protein [Acinetobacter]MCG2574600.1 SCP2 sterol-binding domain-containing protein [Acinetobacter sp. ME22]